MKSNKTPEFRFYGFTEAWKPSKLSTLMDFSNGINAPKENYGKGRKMISVMDILAEGPIIYEDIRNSVEVDSKTESKNKVENGDLIFVRSSEVLNEVGWAKAYLQDEYALYSGFTIRGKKKKCFDAHCIELSLNNSYRKQIERKSGGSTRFNISQSILNSIMISEPSIEEQMKIGNFFKQFDIMIDLHQRELNYLKQTKQGLLQKMFPKEGKLVPELRFHGFTDDWERCKLGELFSERNERSNNGVLISVTINSGVVKASSLDRKDNSSQDKSNYKKVEIGDIAYNSMRMWQGASGVSIYSGILSPAYTVIIPKEGVSSDFFSYQFKQLKTIQTFQANSQGLTSDTWNLKFPLLKEIKVVVPNLEEQIQIGNFFKQLDKTITLHQCELEALKQTKKAFLQKMFV